MKLLPSVLHWSYHREYSGRWQQGFDSYLEKVDSLAKKYDFSQMGINIFISAARNALPGTDKKTVQEVKKRLEHYGLHPIATMGVLEIHAENEVMKASIEQLKKELEIAEWLGASTSQFSMNIHGRLTREKAVRIYGDGLGILGKYAFEYGQNICAENYCTFTGDELATAVEKCGMENVGYLNDIGNWIILGEDAVASTKKFVNKTLHVHLKDYVLEDGVWKSVPFGEGFIPLKECLEVLKNTPIDRTVYMAFETDLDEGDEDLAMEGCFRYMKQWYDSQKK